MKHWFILLVALLYGFLAEASAQTTTWELQNPNNFSKDLYDIQMINATTAYAVGDGNSFIRMTDSGTVWNIASPVIPLVPKVKNSFFSLSFISADTGMIAGSTTILKTTNGGYSWNTLSLPLPPIPWKYSKVLMVSSLVSYVIIDSQYLFITTDGGGSWKRLYNEAVNHIVTIKALSDGSVALAYNTPFDSYGGASLAIISNTGKQWSFRRISTPYPIIDIAFQTDTIATVLLNKARRLLLQTTDQGRSWFSTFSWDTTKVYGPKSINEVGVFPNGQQTMVGDTSSFFYCENGSSWDRARIIRVQSPYPDFVALSTYADRFVMAVGTKGTVTRSDDGGKVWRYVSEIPLDHKFFGISFPKGDTLHGVAIGDWGGMIAVTDDGGIHWKDATPFALSDHPLHAVAFRDSVTVFAVGDYSAILKSTDRGHSWTRIPDSSNITFNDICFASSKIGWAVGTEAGVVKTTDGGQTWKRQHFLNTDTVVFPLCGVSFCNESFGIIVGMSDFLQAHVTTDGGAHWDTLDSGPNKPPLFGFHSRVLSPYHWSISKDHAIFTFNNDSLSVYPAGYVYNPYARVGSATNIDYADSLNGIVTFDSIKHTFSGGVFWKGDTSLTALSVTAPTSYWGWMCGEGGRIYRGHTINPVLQVENHLPATHPGLSIVSIYPNPASTELHILYRTEKSGQSIVHVYSILGEPLLEQQATSIGQETSPLTLNISSLASGTYFLELTNGEASDIVRFIVKH